MCACTRACVCTRVCRVRGAAPSVGSTGEPPAAARVPSCGGLAVVAAEFVGHPGIFELNLQLKM